jgi:transposase
MSMWKRKRYSPEYKQELVELVRRSQSSCHQMALEVGVNPNMLTRWVRETDASGWKPLLRQRLQAKATGQPMQG